MGVRGDCHGEVSCMYRAASFLTVSFMLTVKLLAFVLLPSSLCFRMILVRKKCGRLCMGGHCDVHPDITRSEWSRIPAEKANRGRRMQRSLGANCDRGMLSVATLLHPSRSSRGLETGNGQRTLRLRLSIFLPIPFLVISLLT